MDIDTLIRTVSWVERLARIAKDNNETLADSARILTWTDVNQLMNSLSCLGDLVNELDVMRNMIISRKAELVVMMSDKV